MAGFYEPPTTQKQCQSKRLIRKQRGYMTGRALHVFPSVSNLVKSHVTAGKLIIDLLKPAVTYFQVF